MPCCNKPIHKYCLWDVLENEPSSTKCPLCRVEYDLDGQAKLVAIMTKPTTSSIPTYPHSGTIVDLTVLSLSKRIDSLSILEVKAELDRLPSRQLSKKARSRLKGRLFKRMKIIKQSSELR